MAERYQGKGVKAILVVVGRDANELAAYMVLPRPFMATADQYREVIQRYQITAALTIVVIGRDKRIRYVGVDDPNSRIAATGTEIAGVLDQLTGSR